MKLYKVILMASVAVLLAACCNCRSGKSKNAMQLIDTKWQLAEMEGRTVTAAGESYTLTLGKDGKVSGKGDCNTLMGSFQTPKSGVIKFNALASTRMMCPDQEAEYKFIKLLEASDGYSIDGKTLMLFTDGELKLAFSAKSE